MLDKIIPKFLALSEGNRQAIIDHVDALLEEQAVRGSNNEGSLPLTGESGGATWLEAKYIPKNGKRYGPYFYEYAWQGGKRKFVKYHGKARK